MNSIRRLSEFGQSVWYDNIERNMLGQGGALEQMIKEDDLRGITSNPSIFEKAINGSDAYDSSLINLLGASPRPDSRALFFSLAIEDIQQAADQFRPVYDRTNGLDGYVSLEVSPDLAYDTYGTVEEATRLVARVDRPNLMIKVPATKEGLPAIEALTAAGININATLLFSVDRYEEVARAYHRGLRKRLEAGQPLDHIASVASFFVSRVDSLIDRLLQEKWETASEENKVIIEKLTGRIAIANAKAAYRVFQRLMEEDFADLEAAGARPQRLLWASTGVKNPAYSDVRYIDELIGEQTVNTVPPATYQAFKDHGTVAATLTRNVDEAMKQLEQLSLQGVNLEAATRQLEKEGVKAFEDAFNTLLAAIDEKAQRLGSQAKTA